MSEKSREIRYIMPSGIEFNQELTGRLEEQNRESLRNQEVKEPELEKFLARVDFEQLNNIIKQIALRCGIDEKDSNLLTKEHIFNSKGLRKDEENTTGAYLAKNNAAFIDIAEIKKEAGRIGLDPQILILDTLCHELMHAASKHEVVTEVGTFPFPLIWRALKKILPSLAQAVNSRETKHSHGYSDTQYTNLAPGLDLKKVFFDIFDEGVTEKLSLEVFEEYCRRDGGFASKDEQSRVLEGRKDKTAGYAHAMELVDKVVAAISKKTGVDQQTAWRGIVHGYMSGKNFTDPEVVSLFNEMFTPDFLDALSKAKIPKETQAVIEKYL